MTKSATVICQYAGQCGGCPNIETSYPLQAESKRKAFMDLIQGAGFHQQQIDFYSVGEVALRDKIDISLHANPNLQIGFYGLVNKDLMDIESCPLLSPPMARWYTDFRLDPPPMLKASIRLRVAPDGQRGVWIDGPNSDIKDLLLHSSWLDKKETEGVLVELGQKGKRAILTPSGWQLKKNAFYPWFETLDRQAQTLPLNCTISTFTQVGFAANRALVSWVAEAIPSSCQQVLELGSGVGNFTLAMASADTRVIACEWDVTSLKALELNVKDNQLGNKVSIHRLNFYKDMKSLGELMKTSDCLLVDPPRSGLGIFVQMLQGEPVNLPQYFLYVSCSLGSLKKDLSGLIECGYQVQKAAIVDQFPHTPHGEYLVLLRRENCPS